MNRKCAAGTGRFLEVMARALEVDLDAFGEMSLKADNPAAISSLCTVFAESEVISLIARGEKRENIIAVNQRFECFRHDVNALIHRQQLGYFGLVDDQGFHCLSFLFLDLRISPVFVKTMPDRQISQITKTPDVKSFFYLSNMPLRELSLG